TPAGTRGVGADTSTTTLYRDFYDPKFDPADYARVPADGKGLTPDELRILIILHETAHATGALPPEDSNRPPDFREFNSLIIETWLKKATVTPSRLTGSAATGDDMQPNEILTSNASITSADGRFRLTYQSDTNLVLYRDPGAVALWATGLAPGGVGMSIMQ